MGVIRSINTIAEKRQLQKGIKTITKFLSKLDSVKEVSTKEGDTTHIFFSHGDDKKKSVLLITDDGKKEGMFVETIKTARHLQTYDMQAQPGYLYATDSDYIFYLSGNILYTLPTKRFRCWADKSVDAFRKDCLYETDGGVEIHHHGFFVTQQKLRYDFSKGNVKVSVFRLCNTQGDDFEIIQEL